MFRNLAKRGRTDSLTWRKGEIIWSLNELRQANQRSWKTLNIVSPLTLNDGYFGNLYNDGKHGEQWVPGPSAHPWPATESKTRPAFMLRMAAGPRRPQPARRTFVHHHPAVIFSRCCLELETNTREVWSFTITSLRRPLVGRCKIGTLVQRS